MATIKSLEWRAVSVKSSMHLLMILPCLLAFLPFVQSGSTQGLTDLVMRRLPLHAEDISFVLHEDNYTSGTSNDQYTVRCDTGRLIVEGNSIAALASGSVLARPKVSIPNQVTDCTATLPMLRMLMCTGPSEASCTSSRPCLHANHLMA